MHKSSLPAWLLTSETVFGWVFCGLVLFRWMSGLLFCGLALLWMQLCLYDSGDILSNGKKWQCSSIENTWAISGVHIQHRHLCARLTVGIKHKRGTLWEILGHLRECFKSPPLFLSLLPLSSSIPPSLSLSSWPPHPTHPNLNHPTCSPMRMHLVALCSGEKNTTG